MEVVGFIAVIVGFIAVALLMNLRGKAWKDFTDRAGKDKENKKD